MITPNESYPKLALAIDASAVPAIYFKREDLHPLGSHKGRSIPLMIDKGVAEGITDFVISSSGNAALAAALYIKELNRKSTNKLTLDILVGQKIAPQKRAKLDELKDEYIRVSGHERPLQELFARTQPKDGRVTTRGLRQSNDDTALVGYEALALELSTIPDLRAVFIGTSSGTTAQALATFFMKQAEATTKKKNRNVAPVEVHIVQTTSCHPIALTFNENSVVAEESSTPSIADAIVDHTALRAPKLVPLVESTGGSGWIVHNSAIQTAQKLAEKYAGVSISTNSALSLAGLMNAIYAGRNWNGAIACVICGD